MTKDEIRDIVQYSLQLATGAAAFNALTHFVKDHRPKEEKGNINWDIAVDVVNDNEAAFIDWMNNVAPSLFEDWRDENVPPVKAKETKKDDDEEILIKKNLNPDQRRMIEALEDIRQMVNRSGEEGFSLSKAVISKKLDPKYCTAIVKTGIASKRRSNLNFRKYVWNWKGGKPDYKMLVKLDKKIEEMNKEYIEAGKKKKAEKEKAKAEAAAKAKEAQNQQPEIKFENRPKPPKKETSVTHKSQGSILSPEIENDLRAKLNGINPEDLEKIANHYSEQKKASPSKPSKPSKSEQAEKQIGDVPIQISVTTEGNKKTVSINIEI